MLDLNHYRAPSRFWERIENNPFVQTLVVLCLATAVVKPTHFLPLPPEVK